ncbi:hypothetical protein FRC02_001641 [Tulasnella sp. 418]|nr:hypothetical protein FRC02_001641 [Tulasnella sp. 418]
MPQMTLQDFELLWRTYFHSTMLLFHCLAVFVQLSAIAPLMILHRRQLRFQNRPTAWLNEAKIIIRQTLENVTPFYPREMEGNIPSRNEMNHLVNQLPEVAEVLGLDESDSSEDFTGALNMAIDNNPLILITSARECFLCDPQENGNQPRLKKTPFTRNVTVIDRAYRCVAARLMVAACMVCNAEYLPDRILVKQGDRKRQFYIYEAPYLRISKSASLWVHRTIAIAQAHQILQHQSISGYSSWFNKTYGLRGSATKFSPPKGTKNQLSLTVDQSWRMFVEHMVRMVGAASGYPTIFETTQDPDVETLVKEANRWFIQDGVLPDAKNHTCDGCTHPKRHYQPDQPDIENDHQAFGVAGVDHDDANIDAQIPGDADANDLLQQVPPGNMEHAEGAVVRMAVLDGIVAGHRVCNAPVNPCCRNAPEDFKSARFCAEHRPYNGICGITGCNRPVVDGLKVCDTPSHTQFYEDWLRRFGRTSMHSVQCVMERHAAMTRQRQQGVMDGGNAPPLVQVDLPPLPTLPDDDPVMQLQGCVQHTFQADRVYCIELVSWSCGMPIAFGKLYTSESESQPGLSMLLMIAHAFLCGT